MTIDYDDFREALRRLRAERDLSQDEMARKIGMDHSMVSRVEAGLRTPTRAFVGKVIAGLQLAGYERDELLMLAGFAPVDPASAIEHEPTVARLYRALRAADTLTGVALRDAVAKMLAVVTANEERDGHGD